MHNVNVHPANGQMTTVDVVLCYNIARSHMHQILVDTYIQLYTFKYTIKTILLLS